MKKYLYISIITTGIILFIVAIMLENATISNILVSTGTGIFSSGLTAGLIDLANYIEFNKKKKYRRTIELNYLSYYMLMIAKFILDEHNDQNVKVILCKLRKVQITENNREIIIQAVENKREEIKKEIETIRNVQDYLSLSGFFTDKEIVFLCRSINYYHSKPTKDNIRFVLDNILTYFEMFGDTFK